MKKGRPTKQQIKKIRDELWPLYVRGYSVSFITNKTWYDKKTIYKYFNEWEKQILVDDDKNFDEQIRLEKERVDVVYDNLILELENPLNDIKNEMNLYKNKNEPIPRYLFGYYLKFTKEIANLVERRSSVRMMPLLDDTISEIVEKILGEKHVHN